MTKILVDSELLETLHRSLAGLWSSDPFIDGLRDRLRAALNAPQQKPFAWARQQLEICGGEVISLAIDPDDLQGDTTTCDDIPLYTHPAPSVPDGWQPISTAPKDGTKLLLCVEGFEASTGCFHPDFNRWTTFPIDGFEEKKDWERWFVENEYKPTLWMRLPTLSTAPKSPTTDDQKDAARYRWLRQYPIGIRPWDYYKLYTDELDSKIDAAIAAQKGEKE